MKPPDTPGCQVAGGGRAPRRAAARERGATRAHPGVPTSSHDVLAHWTDGQTIRPFGDGVNANDKACLPSFPYVPHPWSGYNTPHAVVGSTTPPVVPELSQILMFGTGRAGLGYYAYRRRRNRRARAATTA